MAKPKRPSHAVSLTRAANSKHYDSFSYQKSTIVVCFSTKHISTRVTIQRLASHAHCLISKPQPMALLVVQVAQATGTAKTDSLAMPPWPFYQFFYSLGAFAATASTANNSMRMTVTLARWLVALWIRHMMKIAPLFQACTRFRQINVLNNIPSVAM